MKWYEELDWQPAIIAPIEHVLKSHRVCPGEVAKFAGERIRVYGDAKAQSALGVTAKRELGCTGEHLLVHPEDAERLWPELLEPVIVNVSVCTCEIFTD